MWVAIQIGQVIADRRREQHLADVVSRATTAEEEAHAFELIQQSGGPSGVAFFDRNDSPMLSQGFDLAKVYSIEISFARGTKGPEAAFETWRPRKPDSQNEALIRRSG